MLKPCVMIGLAAGAALLVAQNLQTITKLITVEARHGTDVPTLKPVDVTVTVRGDRTRVSSLMPLAGTDAGLELFLLIDDSVDPSLGSQFNELRNFIQDQPSSTAVGVASMDRGSATILQPLTNDHAAAAQALRLPNWKGGPSPYESVHDLIKHWPTSSASVRREIVMISNGADSTETPEPFDASLDIAIQDAQRAGIIIYTIYAPSSRNASTSSNLSWSKARLSRLAEETGGESYVPPFGPAINFAARLRNQYRVTFLVKPGHRGEFRDLKFSTELPTASISAPRKIWIPAQH